jgi:hypothetical protein
MDFKTKRKIIIMKRKFSHTDLAMIGGFLAMVGMIAFNLITQGLSS